MPFKTVFNGRSMVRRQIKTKKDKIETVQNAPPKETMEGQGVTVLPKQQTEAEKKALKAKLQAELFRSL